MTNGLVGKGKSEGVWWTWYGGDAKVTSGTVDKMEEQGKGLLALLIASFLCRMLWFVLTWRIGHDWWIRYQLFTLVYKAAMY